MENKFFSLGKISRIHIIPFFVPLFFMATSYVERDEIIKNEDDYSFSLNINNDYEFPYFINIFISKIFFGLFFFVIKHIIKKKDLTLNLIQTRTLRRYHLNINSKNKKKILLYIIIISLLEVIFAVETIKTLKARGLIEIKLGFTIFVPLFSYFILKNKYYRHHFISIGIGFFGFIFIILSLFFPNSDIEKHDFNVHLRHFLFSIPFSLSLVIIKYLFQHYFISPITFLLIDGLFCLVFSFIYILFKTIIFLSDKDLFINNLKNLLFISKSLQIFGLFICILICSFLYYLLSTITLNLFSPTLLVMTDILSPFFTWLIDSFVNKFKYGHYLNPKQLIFKSVGYFILIIASIIFNEVIICNFWKMNYNTQQEIEERGIKDVKEENGLSSSINDSLVSN